MMPGEKTNLDSEPGAFTHRPVVTKFPAEFRAAGWTKSPEIRQQRRLASLAARIFGNLISSALVISSASVPEPGVRA
jgi:hypothetical protein